MDQSHWLGVLVVAVVGIEAAWFSSLQGLLADYARERPIEWLHAGKPSFPERGDGGVWRPDPEFSPYERFMAPLRSIRLGWCWFFRAPDWLAGAAIDRYRQFRTASMFQGLVVVPLLTAGAGYVAFVILTGA